MFLLDAVLIKVLRVSFLTINIPLIWIVFIKSCSLTWFTIRFLIQLFKHLLNLPLFMIRIIWLTSILTWYALLQHLHIQTRFLNLRFLYLLFNLFLFLFFLNRGICRTRKQQLLLRLLLRQAYLLYLSSKGRLFRWYINDAVFIYVYFGFFVIFRCVDAWNYWWRREKVDVEFYLLFVHELLERPMWLFLF